jgi:hypothetical protein
MATLLDDDGESESFDELSVSRGETLRRYRVSVKQAADSCCSVTETFGDRAANQEGFRQAFADRGLS